MKSVIHQEFVKNIRKTILNKEMAVMKFEKDQVVSILTDILCLGREAVYRRLRGEVKFSLEEVSLIALKLDISIDSLLGLKSKEKSVIELNFLDPNGFIKQYHAKIKEYIHLFETMNEKYGDISILSAFDRLPYTQYLHHKNLAKFRLYKWAYQMNALKRVPFNEFTMPEEVVQSQVKFVSTIRKIKEYTLVLSPNIFSSFIKDIKYFRELNLLTDEDVLILKNELIAVLAEGETLAITGGFTPNSYINIYISDLDFSFSNMLFTFDRHYYTYINVYDVGGIESQNETLCKYQAKWITAIQRYSKLISGSNEIERHRFFEQQRQIINGI